MFFSSAQLAVADSPGWLSPPAEAMIFRIAFNKVHFPLV